MAGQVPGTRTNAFATNMFVYLAAMNRPAHTSAARSRRERPAKPALSRDGVIAAASAILRDEGLERVTMRRVAAALDTGPASLYVYVRDTEDLHAGVLDALLARLHAPAESERDALAGAGGSWRDRLKALLTRYARLLAGHPAIARMAMSTQPSGPHYLALVDAVLALLAEGGVADGEAAWAVDLLLLYATAIAAEQGARRTAPAPADAVSALAVAVATADPGRHPHVARLGRELFSGPGEARLGWALDVLLEGVLRTPRPPATGDGR